MQWPLSYLLRIYYGEAVHGPWPLSYLLRIYYSEAVHGPWPIVYQSAHVTWLDVQRENLAIYADLLSCRRLKKLAVSLVLSTDSLPPAKHDTQNHVALR